MSLTKYLKVFFRSKSREFTTDYFDARSKLPAGRGVGEAAWWNGDTKPIHYRRGTMDAAIIYDVMFMPREKAEYWLPEGLEVRTVLDIGGNIGTTARYLAHRYPRATVHSFEPIPANVEILQKNAAYEPRIQVHPFGLGEKDEMLTFKLQGYEAHNLGTYSMFPDADASGGVTAQVRNAAVALREKGIAHADVIKIDTEGAEYPILTALPTELISKASWIYGELHTHVSPRNDFKLLDFLSQWFAISVHKKIYKRVYLFDACNKLIADRFKSFDRRH